MRLGLNEWCLTRFFAADIDAFNEHFDQNLIARFDANEFGSSLFIEQLKLSDWEYGRNLPPKIGSFELFISPSAPVEFTNGSFIIINYVDFARSRDLVVVYNIFTEDFSAEARVDGHTQVLYDFDAKTLAELEQKLRSDLERRLLEPPPD